MEYRIWNIWNHESDIHHPPVFVSARILTKNVKVDINFCEVSFEWIRDEHTRGKNRTPGKGAYKYIL